MNGRGQWRQSLSAKKKSDCQPRLNNLLSVLDRKGKRVDEILEPKRSVLGEGLRRLLDERGEERAPGSQTAMLEHQGRRHVVRLVNLSQSGAMIAFQAMLPEGDDVMLQLLDHGPVKGHVRWSRDGRVGINFLEPLGSIVDEQ